MDEKALEKAKAGEISSGSPFLDLVRKQIVESYSPEKVREMVDGLCTAEDTKVSKQGTFNTPNWKAREAGLKTILSIAGMENGENVSGRAAPTKIVVVVTGASEVKAEVKEVVEAKEIKGGDQPDETSKSE